MKLAAEKRTKTGTTASKKARAEGKLPAVVYGTEVDSTPILINEKELEDTLREIGMNGVFEIDLEGKTYQVFVKEQTSATIKPIMYHVDLLAFTAGEKVQMSIPVYISGEEDIDEGYVSQSISELDVEIPPAKAPSELTINVSGLEIGDSLDVSKIELPEEAELITEIDSVVVSISAPDDISEDLEPTAEGEEEVAEPEVIGEKEDEEEEETE